MPDKVRPPITPRALEALGNFLKEFQEPAKADTGKVIEYLRKDTFDTNQDKVISEKDTSYDLLWEMLWTDIDKNPSVSPEQRQKLIEARRKLEEALNNASLKEPPKQPLKTEFYDIDRQVLDQPYRLPPVQINNANYDPNPDWARERLSHAGEKWNLDPNKAKQIVYAALRQPRMQNETEMQLIVRGLWTNADYTGTSVFRMEEILGVMLYMNEKCRTEDERIQFKKEFFDEMGKYIRKTFGDNAQFTFDSLLALYQSTDWSGNDSVTRQLQQFVRELATGNSNEDVLGIADTGGFGGAPEAGKGVVVANYNGAAYDQNMFGSLALIRYKDTDDGGKIKYEWLEYETATPVNKTKYTFGVEGQPAAAQAPTSAKPKQQVKEKLSKSLTGASEKIRAILDKLTAEDARRLPFLALLGIIETLKRNLEKDLTVIKCILDQLIAELEKQNTENDLKEITEELKKINEEVTKEAISEVITKGTETIQKILDTSYKGVNEREDKPEAIQKLLLVALQADLKTFNEILKDKDFEFITKRLKEITDSIDDVGDKLDKVDYDDATVLYEITAQLKELMKGISKPEEAQPPLTEKAKEVGDNIEFLTKTIIDINPVNLGIKQKDKDKKFESQAKEIDQIGNDIQLFITTNSNQADDTEEFAKTLTTFADRIRNIGKNLTVEFQEQINTLNKIADDLDKRANEINESSKTKQEEKPATKDNS